MNLGREAGIAAKTTADDAKDAADAAGTASNCPATNVVAGHEVCRIAPNGAPDCVAAADAICKGKGFKSGKSVDMTTAENCPRQGLPGRPLDRARVQDRDLRLQRIVPVADRPAPHAVPAAARVSVCRQHGPREMRAVNLHAKLLEREAAGRPVTVGLIGAGKFGTMFLSQARLTRGLHVVARRRSQCRARARASSPPPAGRPSSTLHPRSTTR